MFHIFKTKQQHSISSYIRNFNAVIKLNPNEMCANCRFPCVTRVPAKEGKKEKILSDSGREGVIL